MNNYKSGKSSLASNLASLRSLKGLSQEKVAEAVGVARQSVAKWEAGESAPDIVHCDALASLYEVSLDDLVHYDQKRAGLSVPPKGKYLFGTVQIGEKGHLVLPEEALECLGLKPGAMLAVLVDSNPGTAGIALMPGDLFLKLANQASGGQEE